MHADFLDENLIVVCQLYLHVSQQLDVHETKLLLTFLDAACHFGEVCGEEMFLEWKWCEFKHFEFTQLVLWVNDTTMHVCIPPLPFSTDGTASTEEEQCA